MPLKFSENGPEIPDALINDLISGDVVFLCGAGISLPQLLGFKALAEKTFLDLGVRQTAGEAQAIKEGRFEEALGSLARRLADPMAMTTKVAELLAVPEAPELANHTIVLRLSRSVDNRIAVVTTNFDTLIERAVPGLLPATTPSAISFSGQAMPAPGSIDFGGVIHLHGRLVDEVLGLDATTLVLTSSDYGDAYMRSGWASRFLFDLARCRTIVLLGYRAGDAPVRYFLNVLEADRTRFADLKPVYAFDSYDADARETEDIWKTLGVQALTYKVEIDGEKRDHRNLWQDLSALADLVERPKQWRRGRMRAILSAQLDAASDSDRRAARWLLAGKQDLWTDVIEVVADPAWLKWIDDEKLWTRDDAVRVIAAWLAKDFKDWSRLRIAADWLGRLGKPFVEDLAWRFGSNEGVEEPIAHAWRLVCRVRAAADFESPQFVTAQPPFLGQTALNADLEAAVSLLEPRLRLSASMGRLLDRDLGAPAENRRLSSVVWTQYEVEDTHAALEVVATLTGLPARAPEIVEMASAVLARTLRFQCDLEEIGRGYDTNDTGVPSVEDHEQNEFHDGAMFLVRVAIDAFPAAAAVERERFRKLAFTWPSMPGRLGTRMLLQVMRDPATFEADEAVSTLLDIPRDDFWMIERETALLIRDRTGQASADLVLRLRERICAEAAEHFAQYDKVIDDEIDWRDHARDKAVWLHLRMIETAGRLDEAGKLELEAILARREYLRRAVEDRDYFGSYSYGVTTLQGDSDTIVQAEPDDRLIVAQELRRSRDIERRQGWPSFCRMDPQGAFDTLSGAAPAAANAELWSDFLQSLVFQREDGDALRAELVSKSLAILAPAGPEVKERIASSVADIISFGPTTQVEDVWAWWDTCWAILSVREIEDPDGSEDTYSKAIDTPVGRLAQSALAGVDAAQKKGAVLEGPLERYGTAIKTAGRAGMLARFATVRGAAYLLGVDRLLVEDCLLPALRGEGAEGRTLRAIALTHGSITPALCHAMPDVIICATIESRADNQTSRAVVSHVLRAAVSLVRQDGSNWGIALEECARVLRECPDNVRVSAANVIRQWLHTDKLDVIPAWKTVYGPLFERIWPKERSLQVAGATADLVAIASATGPEFAEAFRALRHFIVPTERARGSVGAMLKNDALSGYPDVSLDVLWQICGPAGAADYYDMAKALDLIVKAKPALEYDRRFQWLEQRAFRF